MNIALIAALGALELVLIVTWLTLRARRRAAERTVEVAEAEFIDLRERLGTWSEVGVDAEVGPFAPLSNVAKTTSVS